MIVGFGNPGKRYRETRHNLGFQAVELLCKELGLRLSDQCFQALSTSTIYHDKKIVVACPQTYMNRSGLAVKYLVDYYDAEISDIMVIHDDLDLDAGRVKVTRGGGAGGHHGVESVIHILGTNEFNRIKVGIGRPRHNEPIEEFVLSPPYQDQQKLIKEALSRVTKAIKVYIVDGIEPAMTNINAVRMRKKEVESSCKD